MLSTTECKRILNRKGVFYSDAEIEIIKEVLCQLAEMQKSITN